MWPVFSQLHVYALAWPCFRAALRSRPAFLPQTDDGSPAVSPVGQLVGPAPKPSQAGDGVPARRWRRARPAERVAIAGVGHRTIALRLDEDDRVPGRWSEGAEGGSMDCTAGRRIGGRRPGAHAPCSPVQPRRLPARPGAVASPGPVAVAPPRPVAFAPPAETLSRILNFRGVPLPRERIFERPAAPAAPHNDKRPAPALAAACAPRGRKSPAAAAPKRPRTRQRWWHSSLRPGGDAASAALRAGWRRGSLGGAGARGRRRSSRAGRRLGGRRRGSPDGAEARRAATRLSGQGGAQRVAAQLAGGAGARRRRRGSRAGRRRGERRRGSPGRAEAWRAEARLAGGAEARRAAPRLAGRAERGGRRRGPPGRSEALRAAARVAGRGGARRAAPRLAGRGGNASGGDAARRTGRGLRVAARLAGRSGGAAGGGAGRQAV
eukprot:tig00001027_g6373.t1